RGDPSRTHQIQIEVSARVFQKYSSQRSARGEQQSTAVRLCRHRKSSYPANRDYLLEKGKRARRGTQTASQCAQRSCTSLKRQTSSIRNPSCSKTRRSTLAGRRCSRLRELRRLEFLRQQAICRKSRNRRVPMSFE